jgi:hypothetical protein
MNGLNKELKRLAPIPGQLRNPSLTITARATGLFAPSRGYLAQRTRESSLAHREARAQAAQIKDSDVSLI